MINLVLVVAMSGHLVCAGNLPATNDASLYDSIIPDDWQANFYQPVNVNLLDSLLGYQYDIVIDDTSYDIYCNF